jgi:hypothetical protein
VPLCLQDALACSADTRRHYQGPSGLSGVSHSDCRHLRGAPDGSLCSVPPALAAQL